MFGFAIHPNEAETGEILQNTNDENPTASLKKVQVSQVHVQRYGNKGQPTSAHKSAWSSWLHTSCYAKCVGTMRMVFAIC